MTNFMETEIDLTKQQEFDAMIYKRIEMNIDSEIYALLRKMPPATPAPIRNKKSELQKILEDTIIL